MSNPVCFFVSDLHGKPDRYAKLFVAIEDERPQAVFLGGDLLPHRWAARLGGEDFIADVVKSGMMKMRDALGSDAPRVFIILGNDDDRTSETAFLEGDSEGLWEYIHERWVSIGSHELLGYANVPPTPFLLKDWERYDVSRYTGPGCVSPEEGQHTVLVNPDLLRFGTIAADLDRLADGRDLTSTIVLFHSPPYQTDLDRAGLDGKTVDHVALDVHVGSMAIKRFIEDRQPLLTLHGHIHESAGLTGSWRQGIGRTHAFTAAHDGPELALVRFDLENLESASRELI
jgi:Icc-related predicted phosphoesterase